MYKKTDPEIIIALLKNFINAKSYQIIEIVIKKHYESIWKLLPMTVIDTLSEEIKKKTPKYIKRIYKKFEKDIDHAFNFENVIVDSLTGQNVHHLIEVFQKTGKKEFDFIVKSGFWFGLGIGILQVFFYEVFSQW